MVVGIFVRADDSTCGVKDKKELWLACQSIGDSTGGRAHGPTAMLCVFFFFLNGLISTLFLSSRHVTDWDPGLFDPARCAHRPGNGLRKLTASGHLRVDNAVCALSANMSSCISVPSRTWTPHTRRWHRGAMCHAQSTAASTSSCHR